MKHILISLILMFPLVSYGSSQVSYEDLRCLTENIYFESRGEPILGQAMVGHSVLNRVKDRRWKSTVCEVVYQRKQYSWTLEKKRPIKDMASYKMISDLAYTLLSNRDFEESTGVTNYLRCDIRETMKDKWWQRMTFLGQVGAHCFYREE